MKNNKCSFIVNLTKVENCDDIRLEFIKGKVLSGVKITEEEFKFIVSYGVVLAFNTIDKCIDNLTKSYTYTKIENDKLVKDIINLIDNSVNPKKPWYKRFWGWITRKK